jgi:hypothetical protein
MLDLFHHGVIEHLTGVLDGGFVPIENGSEARWAIDSSGRQWVRKRESDTGFQPLLAEAASYLLGLKLQLCQPQGAVFHDGHEWSWMSQRIVAAGEHWHGDMRDLIVNPDEVGRMLTLDALIINEDRHRRNILVEPVYDEAHLRLWAIDSGNALIGQLDDFIGRDLTVPSPHNHARGLPIDVLRPAALAAAQVAAQLPEEKLRAIVAEACALARESSVDRLAAALTARCRQAPSIVSGYLDALGVLS